MIAKKKWRLYLEETNGYKRFGISEVQFISNNAVITGLTWKASELLPATGLDVHSSSVANLYNNTTEDTCWFNTIPGWITVESPTDFSFDSFNIYSSAVASVAVGAAPRVFKLQYWDDASSQWVDYLSYTNVIYSGNSEKKSFTTSNADNSGGTGGGGSGETGAIVKDFEHDFSISSGIAKDFVHNYRSAKGPDAPANLRAYKLSKYLITRAPHTALAFKLSKYVVTAGPGQLIFDMVHDYANPFKRDFEHDYAYPAPIYRDFEHDYAQRSTVSRDFIHNYASNLVWMDFQHDYAAELHKDFTHDYSREHERYFVHDYRSDMFKNFEHSWSIDAVGFAKNFQHDYMSEIGKSFIHSYSILDAPQGIYRDFAHDYQIFRAFQSIDNGLRFPPENPIKETWNFSTNIITTFNGTEQRAERREHPRSNLDITMLILDERERRMTIEDIVGSTLGAMVPQWQIGTRIINAVALGGTSITAKQANTDIRPGDYVYYLTPQAVTGDFGFVIDVAGDIITLQSGVSFALPANSWIIPARRMRVGSGAGPAMRSVAGQIGFSLSSLDRRPILRPGQALGGVPTLDGLAFLDKRPQANSDVAENYNANPIFVDLSPDLAPIGLKTWDMAKMSGARVFRTPRLDGLDYWREFAYLVAGSRLPFWLSTYRKDLEPVSFVGTSLTVAGKSHMRFADFAAYKRLQIETEAGVQNLKISTATLNGGNVDFALDAPIVGSVIKRISYLNQVRLDDDTISLTHTAAYVEVTLNIKVTNE